MSTLQIRNLPDDLHAQLGERAGRLGVSMSEYVTRLLRDDLSRPLFDDWVASVSHDSPPRRIDTLSALDAVRDEYDPPR
ncbi:MAG: hypothetical protein WAV90_18435 [Gordonia amarae]